MTLYLAVFADPSGADVPQSYTEVEAEQIDYARDVLRHNSQFIFRGCITCRNTGGYKANFYTLGDSVEAYSYPREKRIDLRANHIGNLFQTAEQFLALPRPQIKDIFSV